MNMLKTHSTIQSQVLISVILPVYNVSEYLVRTFKSLKLSRFRNFEILAIDDCSTDDSLNQLKEIKKNFTDIRFEILENKTNRGLSFSRNRGIQEAKAQYLYFFDPDDFLENDFLQTISSLIYKYKYPDSIIFNYRKINEKKQNLETMNLRSGLIDGSKAMSLFLKLKLPVSAWCHITKKEVFVKNKISFAIGHKFEDTDTTPEAYYYSDRIYVTNQILYNYFKRSTSIMNQRSLKDYSEHLFMVNRLYLFVMDHNDIDRDIAYKYLFYSTSGYYFWALFHSSFFSILPDTKQEVTMAKNYYRGISHSSFVERLKYVLLFLPKRTLITALLPMKIRKVVRSINTE